MEYGSGDVETTTDSSMDVTDSTSDLSDLSGAHTQGLALLQKLQQLKVSGAEYECFFFILFTYILFPIPERKESKFQIAFLKQLIGRGAGLEG